MLKKRLIQALWIAAGVATIVLLEAAMQQKNKSKCTNVRIEISDVEQHVFLDEKDVLSVINSNGSVAGREISSIDLRRLESLLKQNPWVKNAELFFNNQKELIVNIQEREPIARIFTVQGSSFYIDTAAHNLPLSEKLTARVPVFTSFPTDSVKTYADSLLMKDVIKLGKFIHADSFWSAQIAQINILPNATFELIPVIGNHIVTFGNADDIEKKFSRLFTFYKSAWLQNGFNKYERLNVEYNNQVVATKREASTTIVSNVVEEPKAIIKKDTIAKTKDEKIPKAVFKKQ
ncbi:MAG: FtsQ-type POTRA domain-containing protein [Chitinophagales bacterium]|nr:FtsQ-type POTRA domain-containing protein [Chitinophagales bacterium]